MTKLAAIVLSLGLIACGDDGGARRLASDGATADDVGAPPDSTPGADSAAPVDSEVPQDTGPAAPNTLAYADGMLGGDGQPCVTVCALNEDAGVALELAVVYRDGDGNPLADRTVRFTTDAPAALARLSTLSSYTDAHGVTSVTLRTFDIPGTVVVTASVSGDPEAGALDFVVTLDLPPAPVLLISSNYVGATGPVDLSLRLFEQVDGQPSCGVVHPDAGGMALEPDLLAGPYGLYQQAALTDLPGLAEAGEQTWLAQLVGPAAGTPLSVGCAEGIVVRPMATAQQLIYVLDLPPSFRGSYRSTTRADLVTGATGTLGRVVDGVVQLFTEPGALILGWACQGASGALGTVCGVLINDDGDPTIVGGVVTDAADAMLLAVMADTIGGDVTQVGNTVAEILKDLRLLSDLEIAAEPSVPKADFSGAYVPWGEASEEWTHVRFRWKYGPSCKPSGGADPDCGWTSIPLEEVYGARPGGVIDAGVDLDLALHVDQHEVTGMTYGPLINAIFEKRLLSLMFGDGSNGLAPVDSWEDLISILLGDRGCLNDDDCCDSFATRIEDEVAAYVLALIPAACEAAIPAAANLIRDRLAALDGAMTLGTPAGGGCRSHDGDDDRWIDAWGSAANPCEWDLYFPTSDGSFRPDSGWRAVRR